jgi:hypothetical protein
MGHRLQLHIKPWFRKNIVRQSQNMSRGGLGRKKTSTTTRGLLYTCIRQEKFQVNTKNSKPLAWEIFGHTLTIPHVNLPLPLLWQKIEWCSSNSIRTCIGCWNQLLTLIIECGIFRHSTALQPAYSEERPPFLIIPINTSLHISIKMDGKVKLIQLYRSCMGKHLAKFGNYELTQT